MLTMAVLVDPLCGERPELREERDRFAEALGGRGQVFVAPDEAALCGAVDEISAGSFDVLGVTGADAGLGCALSAMMRRGGVPPGLRMMPLGGGRQELLATSLGISRRSPVELVEAVSTLSRKGPGFRRPDLRQFRRQSLRLVASTRPSADHGFVFAAGALYNLMERRPVGGRSRGLRAALGAARGLFESERAWDATEARITVEGAPLAESLRFVGASTLGVLPFGLRSLAGAPNSNEGFGFVWHDIGFAATAAMALKLSRGRVDQPGSRTMTAQRVVVDFSSGYCLDGALFPAVGPQVLSIEAGPTVTLTGFPA